MSARAPNILLVLTTQWRASAFGFAGDPNARTPNLDALAAESVNFTQAVTPHPFGPFARAAMFTGVPSPENGIRDYFDPLPADSRTIAHTLRERGYATAFFGKWHLGRRDPAAALVGQAHAKTIIPPEGRGGFEVWEGFESGFLLNDPLLHGSRLPDPVKFAGYQSDVVCSRARDWITSPLLRSASYAGPGPAPATVDLPPSNGARSGLLPPGAWFCVVSLEAPHPPYDAPAAGIFPRDPKKIILPANVPRGGEAEARARKELAGYYAHIEATDRAVGRLLAEVASDTGQVPSRESAAGGTVVVFASVHGDMHGAHGLFRKGWPYEESVRVPWLVRAPGVNPRKDESAVSLVELPAMLAALADGTPPATGQREARISMPSVVALPFQCDRTWRGVRTKARKLVLNADGKPWLFFDLEQDPLETSNLVNEVSRWEEMASLIARIGR